MIHIDDFSAGIQQNDDPFSMVPNSQRPEHAQTITSCGADLKDTFPYDWDACSKCGGKGTYWQPCRKPLGSQRLVTCDHTES